MSTSPIASSDKIQTALTNLGIPNGFIPYDTIPLLRQLVVALGNITAGGGGGSTAWGSITGTLSNQTDLQNALNAKLTAASNLSDLANASTARTNLGLGTAATLNVGTAANNVVQLDGSAKLPAVDGSQLTNLPSGGSGFLVKSANYTAVAGDRIATDLSGGSFTITLPATPSAGDMVEIVPATGTNGTGYFGGHTLTVARNGSTINGAAADITTTSNLGMLLVYAAGSWRSYSILQRGSGNLNEWGRFDGLSVKTIAGGGARPIEFYDGTGNLGYNLGVWNGSWPSTPRIISNYSTFLGFVEAAGRGCAIGGYGADTTVEFLGSNDGYVSNFRGPLELYQVASGGTCATNSGRVYAKDVSGTAEIFAKDEAGNEVQLTSHNRTGPDWLYNNTPGEEIKFAANYYVGVVRYRNTNTGEIFIESFAQHNERLGLTGDAALTVSVWADDQAAHVATSQQRHAEWESRRDAFVPSEQVPTFTEPEPVIHTPKPEPAELIAQRAALPAQLAAQEVALAAKASRAAMAAQFESLPVSVQAQFWTVRTSMESAMDKGRFDVARAMLEATVVPADLASTKQALLDLMPS